MTSISAKDLARFDPVSELDQDQLEQLVADAHVETVKRSAVLMERGSTDNWTVYLLKGTLALEAADSNVLLIEANSPRAFSPVARLQPRQYTVVAREPSTIVRIASDKIDAMFKSKQRSSYRVTEELDATSADFACIIEAQVLNDLEKDALTLPSLPEVGAVIRDELKERTASVGHISRVMQADPVLAAKIMKLANSSVYGPAVELRTCHAATTRVGPDKAALYLTDVAAEEIFHGNTLMHGWMRNLWEHCVSVAAFSYVISHTMSSIIEPEQAWLAGLVHDIGTVAILSYANRYSRHIHDTKDLNTLISPLRGSIGGAILERWQFPREFVLVAEDCERWDRDVGPDADLCDIVLIAQLHTFLINSRRTANFPVMRQLPAFKKLDLDKLGPSVGPKIINEAKEMIAQTKTRFGL